VARLFRSRAKFENYFSLRAALFKISDDKVTILQSRKKLVLLMLLLAVFDQISGTRRSMLLFLTTEKGPRAAKKVEGPHFGHVCYIPRVARLFCSLAKFENY